MPKKRRITQNQARFLAIRYIQVAVIDQNLETNKSSPNNQAWAFDNFGDLMPARWGDGQTSDQSWEHVWDEVHIQMENIMGCLAEEAQRILKENPEFRYPAYPPGEEYK